MCTEFLGLIKICLNPQQQALVALLLAVWNAWQQYQLSQVKKQVNSHVNNSSGKGP
jgi:hypothetical protein